MSAAGSFEFVDDVTSDLSFVARGDSPEAVFCAASEALLAATVERPEAVAERTRETLHLRDAELDLLLLRFLNELVFLRDARGLLLRAREVRIDRGEDVVLGAVLVGEPLDAARHRLASEVKAVTAHGLRVRQVADGWEASVTLDV